MAQTITQGKSFVDTGGRTGIAQYNPNTGAPLSAGQSVNINPSGGGSTGGGAVDTKGNPVTPKPEDAIGFVPPGKAAPSQTPTTKIDTSQPSPATTKINPPTNTSTIPYAQALQNLQSGGLTGKNLSEATDVLKQKYGVALNELQKNGGEVANTVGAGSAAVTDALAKTAPPPEPAPNPMIKTLSESPEYQQLLADHTAYLNSVNQRQSLTQEYQNLSNSLGLPQLNTDLINMKNVINGTEDDIRNEVTKAGGFATNSQVMALSSARNKVLIQNYNNLLETRNNAQQQLTTMIGLSEKDRAMADQQFQQQLNFDQQMVNFRQKAIDNSKSIYQTLLTNPSYGAKAILAATGGDPNTTQMVEQSLGLSPGGLQGLASQETSALTHVQLSNGSDVMVDKQGNIVKTLGGATPVSGGSGGGIVGDNISNVDPTSGSILAQTGMSIPAFSFLTQGSSALTRMTAAQRLQYMNEAQNWANKNGIDISTFASQYKAQNDVLQKNIERAANTKVFAGEVTGSADALASVINEKDLQPGLFGKLLGISNFKPTNLVSLATGKQVNDPLTQKYSTQLQAMTNDYAGYLAASRGATQPEMSDIQDAATVVSNGLNSGSVQAFKQAVQANEEKVAGVVSRAVTDAQKSVWDLFGVGGNFKGGQVTPNTQNTVISPEQIPSGYYQASDGLLYKK